MKRLIAACLVLICLPTKGSEANVGDFGSNQQAETITSTTASSYYTGLSMTSIMCGSSGDAWGNLLVLILGVVLYLRENPACPFLVLQKDVTEVLWKMNC